MLLLFIFKALKHVSLCLTPFKNKFLFLRFEPNEVGTDEATPLVG